MQSSQSPISSLWLTSHDSLYLQQQAGSPGKYDLCGEGWFVPSEEPDYRTVGDPSPIGLRKGLAADQLVVVPEDFPMFRDVEVESTAMVNRGVLVRSRERSVRLSHQRY